MRAYGQTESIGTDAIRAGIHGARIAVVAGERPAGLAFGRHFDAVLRGSAGRWARLADMVRADFSSIAEYVVAAIRIAQAFDACAVRGIAHAIGADRLIMAAYRNRHAVRP
jgi:hypothetical protein